MPELPEVETIRNVLREGQDGYPSLLGLEIIDARVYWPRTLATPSVEVFQDRIRGQVIQELGRRGKYLILQLSSDTLLIHLRMSGDLFLEPLNAELAPHHRMILEFQEGFRLAFNDTRKFGRVWLVGDPQTVIGDLGPEPLDEEFTPQVFWQLLQSRHRQLKPLLMDQKFLAGLGNIYTDEALHMANLHPLSNSREISQEQSEVLWKSIRQVLEEGIRRNGASIDWVYRGGDFQNYFRVYGRSGEACPQCGSPIERIIVGQRSTHFCPKCQPLVVGSNTG
jgi:formamidopyrimidine-DNA glycosylase